MSNTYKCFKCEELTAWKMAPSGNSPKSICTHCGAMHEVAELAVPAGAPEQLEIVGLLEKD